MDNFQTNSKTVYRVLAKEINSKKVSPYASYLFGPAAKQGFSEIKTYTRIIHLGPIKIKKENYFLDEEGFVFADQSIFNTLTFKLVDGSVERTITEANSMAISEKMAYKYFENKEAVGKSLLLSIKGEEQLLNITAVYADLPENSSIRMDFIANLEFGKKNLIKMLVNYGNETEPKVWEDSWDHTFYINLVQVAENTDINALEKKINRMFQKHVSQEEKYEYTLQRYDKIYLHSLDFINRGEWKQGKLSSIYIFSGVALLILIIACFNYLILSLAQSEKRAKEIGIRKTNGADFKTLLRQILLESLTISCISLPLAIGCTEMLLPILNSLLDKNLVINYSENILFISGALVITILISSISGFYLAIYLNKFNPGDILRGKNIRSGTRSLFLKSLVILQITIFIALTVSSFVLIKQLKFVSNYNPGIDAQNVFLIKLNDFTAQQNYKILKEELEKLPEIQSVTGSLFIPPTSSRFSIPMPRIDDPSKTAILETILADYNFVETLGLRLIEGTSFSKDFPANNDGIIINESAIKELGLKETVGTKLPIGRIIGVVKDFHVHDLHSKITPVYLTLYSQTFYTMAVKTKSDATSLQIKKLWHKINPDTPIEISTLTDHIKSQYQSEQRLANIILIFTIIAILIAALGLFGLANFITILRTKEIGIRKVNGGTLLQMIFLFWKELISWTAIAFLLSAPVAWYIMNKWLENFAYRTSLDWWIFVTAGILAIFVAILAVSWQSYKAANKNPVEALRYE